MLMSHLGRPTEGEPAEEFSLAPVADHLGELLERRVRLVKHYLDTEVELADGEVALLENVRFNSGEKKDDEALAKRYAALCDVYVMDAFGTAHRARHLPMAWHASRPRPAPAPCWPTSSAPSRRPWPRRPAR